jgi:hypothetical protein
MALQFFGVWSVVKDLRSAQRDFAQPGVRQRIRNKLAEWPKRGTTISLSGAAVATATGRPARIMVRAPMDPSGPWDVRLKALEQNFKHLDQELGQVEMAVHEERALRAAAIKQEAQTRTQADDAISKKLEDVATGSFTFSLFGVIWLAIGMVLGSTSTELAKWIGKLAHWTRWTW